MPSTHRTKKGIKVGHCSAVVYSVAYRSTESSNVHGGTKELTTIIDLLWYVYDSMIYMSESQFSDMGLGLMHCVPCNSMAKDFHW